MRYLPVGKQVGWGGWPKKIPFSRHSHHPNGASVSRCSTNTSRNQNGGCRQCACTAACSAQAGCYGKVTCIIAAGCASMGSRVLVVAGARVRPSVRSVEIRASLRGGTESAAAAKYGVCPHGKGRCIPHCSKVTEIHNMPPGQRRCVVPRNAQSRIRAVSPGFSTFKKKGSN